ncbi:hypothetical protein MRX96_010822 [Rhipicephalus microplus]
MRRGVLHRNLVRVLTAARSLSQQAGSCRRTRQRRPREADDTELPPARRQRTSSPEVELRLNHARQFVAGLAPNPVDMDALDEELGPDPYFELLDKGALGKPTTLQHARPGDSELHHPEVELRLDRTRQFVAGLAPNPMDMDCLEEKLGPDPYFELLDEKKYARIVYRTSA